MNLRDIKKDIEYVIGAFIDDCTIFTTVHPGSNTDEIVELVDKAVDLFNELRDKVGTPEGDKKVYYNGLRKRLITETDSLYDSLSEAVKKGLGK